jgi:hypothetical protein
MKRILGLLIPFLMTATSYGASLSVVDGQELSVPVSPEGITVQLPTFVKIVTPAKGHYIEPLAPPSMAVEGQGQAQAPADVRAFVIKPAKSGVSEKITFILADERTVTLQLSPAQTSDAFYDIKWASRGLSGTSGGKKDNGFLSAERSLMLTMLRDEDSASRKNMDVDVKLDKYPELKIKLARTYQLQGYTGYVFTITNTSSKTLRVNSTVLTVGSPNKAVLTQIDHETLEPCSQNNSSDPRGTGCLTALRMVVNGTTTSAPKLGSNERMGMPFTYDLQPNATVGGPQ